MVHIQKRFTYKIDAFISPFIASMVMLYFSQISFYTLQYTLKLTTLHHIESYYDKQIETHIKKGDRSNQDE